MGREFPHLKGATEFPGQNVNAYKYENTFDYNRYEADVRIKLCCVPWCADYENVVDFASDAERDRYLDALPGETFSTLVRVQPDTSIKVEIPYESMQRFNYCVIDMPTATSAAEPVVGAELPRIGRYLYFIDSIERRATNTTECYLHADMWQQYIHELTFDYVMLERGHAPMAATDADTYLSDPRSNSALLLAPDFNAGDSRPITTAQRTHFINEGDMWAVFFTYADAQGGTWGTEGAFDWTTPAPSHMTTQGVPAADALAVEVSDLATLLANADAQLPQFKACVLGIAFVPKSLVSVSAGFVFLGVTCARLIASEQRPTMLRIDKDMFAYPEEYADIAKLYTYPYAAIEISDTDGTTHLVRIEDTNGRIDLVESLSLVFPWINVDCRILGIGGVSEITEFRAPDGRHYTFGGAFADTVKTWDVPVFQVIQSGERDTTWADFYNRGQARLAADNARDNALNAADTALSNAQASNATAEANVNRLASTMLSNNALTVAANNNLTSVANETASSGTRNSNSQVNAAADWANYKSSASYQADMAGLAVASENNDASAAASGVNTLVNAVGGLVTGGPVGAITGAITGAVNTAVGWSTANAALAVSQSNSELIFNATTTANLSSAANTVNHNNYTTNIQNDQRDENNSIQNNLSTGTTTNNANASNSNAAATRSTGDANASRTNASAHYIAGKNVETAYNAIQNSFDQNALRAPLTHGAHANGEHAVTRPMGYVARAVTESPYAIAAAGDNFLRYGYTLGRQWHVDKWQLMPHFTYWKCSEVWCYGPDVIASASDAIKNILVQGVTVWSDPDEIGRVSIHDNA